MRLRFLARIVLLGLWAGYVHGYSLLGFRYPLGMQLPVTSGKALGMGTAGAGVNEAYHLGLENPANQANIDKTVFSAMLSFRSLKIIDNAGNYTNHLTVIPEEISFGLPIGKAGGLSFCMLRTSDMTAKFRLTSTRGLESADTKTDSLRLSFSRNGGLSAFEGGWGIAVVDWCNLGITYQRGYLQYDATRIAEEFGNAFNLSDPAKYSRSVKDSANFLLRTNRISAGVQFPFEKISFGVSARYFLYGSGAYYQETFSKDSVPFIAKGETGIHLPWSVAGGLAYTPFPELLLACDYEATYWECFTQEKQLLFPSDRDLCSSVAMGLQFVPAINMLSPRYWETIRYYTGFRVGQLPVQDHYKLLFSLGLGLPLHGNGILDLVAEYGYRRQAGNEQIDERIFNVSIGINGGRKWRKSSRGSY